MTQNIENNYSCLLGVNRMNVQGYPDVLVLFALTASGLIILLESIEEVLFDLESKINDAKTKVLTFKTIGEKFER